MNEKLKHHWKENIKPVLYITTIGILLIIGMRIGEIIWPETATKVFVCFASDIGKVDECAPLKNAR